MHIRLLRLSGVRLALALLLTGMALAGAGAPARLGASQPAAALFPGAVPPERIEERLAAALLAHLAETGRTPAGGDCTLFDPARTRAAGERWCWRVRFLGGGQAEAWLGPLINRPPLEAVGVIASLTDGGDWRVVGEREGPRTGDRATSADAAATAFAAALAHADALPGACQPADTAPTTRVTSGELGLSGGYARWLETAARGIATFIREQCGVVAGRLTLGRMADGEWGYLWSGQGGPTPPFAFADEALVCAPDGLNLRAGPSLDAAIEGVFAYRERVTVNRFVLTEPGDSGPPRRLGVGWYQVAGPSGFVASDFLLAGEEGVCPVDV